LVAVFLSYSKILEYYWNICTFKYFCNYYGVCIDIILFL